MRGERQVLIDKFGAGEAENVISNADYNEYSGTFSITSPAIGPRNTHGGSAEEDSGGESTAEAERNVVYGRRDRETGGSLDEHNNKISVLREIWNSQNIRTGKPL